MADEFRAYKRYRNAMAFAAVLAAIGLCIGGFAIVVLAQTNRSLNSRLSCRATATDQIQINEARALQQVANEDFVKVREFADNMLAASFDLERC